MTRSSLARDMDLRPGDHVALLYQAPEELAEYLSRYVRGGLEHGEKVLCFVDEPVQERLLQRLRDDGLDPASPLRSGQLALETTTEAYIPDGQFSPEAMMARLQAALDQAAAEGRPGLRVAGDTVWMLGDTPGVEQGCAYEAQVNTIMANHPWIAMCTYDRARFPGELLQQVIMTHPLIISDGRLCDNPHYLPPETYRHRDCAATVVESWLQQLQRSQDAEEQLRRSEERYRVVADYTYDWEMWHDPEGKLVYVSPSCERITGYSREEFERDPELVLRIVHPDDRGQARAHMEARLSLPDEAQLDVRIVRKDGELRWISHYCHPVHGDDGSYLGRRSSNRDITSRKQAELRQEESAAQAQRRAGELDAVISAIADGVSICAADGTLIRCNDAARRMLRYGDERVMRERFRRCEYRRSDGTLFALKDLPLSRSLRGGIVVGEIIEMVWPDGSSTWVNSSSAPILDQSGTVTGAVLTTTDITPLREAQRQIQRLAAQAQDRAADADQRARELEAIMSAIADGVMVYDPEGRVERINEAGRRLVRYTEDDLQLPLNERTQALGFVDENLQPVEIGDLAPSRARRGETVTQLVTRVTWADGAESWLSTSAAPIRDERGQVVRAVSIMHDITEAKRVQQQVETERARLFSVLSMLPGYCCLLTPEHDFGYVNQGFIDLFGDPGTRKCYNALFDRDEPCDNCRSFDPLKDGRPIVWEWEAPTGRVFQVYDSVFKDQSGTDVILEFAVDVTDRTEAQQRAQLLAEEAQQQAEELMQHRNHLEGIVAERTRELVRYQADLRSLAMQLTAVEEQERQRIATAIHDDISQPLGYLRIQVHALRASLATTETASTFATLDRVIGETIEISRRLTMELTPPVLHQMDFESALHWLADRMHGLHGYAVNLRLTSGCRDVPPELRIVLFRTIQELLTNAAKHAACRTVWVDLRCAADGLKLMVRDDGKGFEPGELIVSEEGGFGLFSMRERANFLGGELQIASEPGKGARFTLLLPLNQDAQLRGTG